MYVHSMYMVHTRPVLHIPVVPTGFRGQHRDGVQSDLPLPASAREDEDKGSPCPEDGDFFHHLPTKMAEWLPTKLAEWIGENLQDELGFPDKADQRADPGSGWTPAELNHFLQAHVVDCALSTFGCVEWESDLCRGIMRARCYPFDMPKYSFHGMNPKVMYIHCTNMYIHAIYIEHTCT